MSFCLADGDGLMGRGGHMGRDRLTGGGGRGGGLMHLSRRGGGPDDDADDAALSGVMYRASPEPQYGPLAQMQQAIPVNPAASAFGSTPSRSTIGLRRALAPPLASSSFGGFAPNPVASPLPEENPSGLEKISAIPTGDILAAVRAFVDLQSFDGHWDCDEALSTFFASEIVRMKDAGAQENPVLATVLVLAWLKASEAQYSDLWEMVADKGTSWLATQDNSELLMHTAMSTIRDRT